MIDFTERQFKELCDKADKEGGWIKVQKGSYLQSKESLRKVTEGTDILIRDDFMCDCDGNEWLECSSVDISKSPYWFIITDEGQLPHGLHSVAELNNLLRNAYEKFYR